MNKEITEHKPRETPSEFDSLEQLLKDSGLTSREAAPLFKVSNTTILKWAHGAHPNQEVIRAYALRAMQVLRAMVAKGDLPLRDDVPHKDRMRVIWTLWKRACDEAKAGGKAAPR